jgi:protein gp37
MGENSAISWTHHTFNPWVGCSKISPACEHCYAESWAKRAGFPGLWSDGERRRTSAANWAAPLKWNRMAAEAGTRARVFCASLADVFDNVVPEGWRADLFRVIRQTPNLDWLLLTKRIGNAATMIDRALVDGHLLTSREPSWPWPTEWDRSAPSTLAPALVEG